MSDRTRAKTAWRRWSLVAAVFALALGARLLFLGLRGPFIGGDTYDYYLRLAHNLATYGAFSLDVAPPLAPTIERMPVYPVFLALVGGWRAPNLGAVALVQAVLDAAVAVGVLLLASASAPRLWALAAGFAYALHPGAIFWSTAVLTEPVFAALLVAGAGGCALGLRRGAPLWTAAGGLALGLAALTRPIALPLPLVMGAVVAARRETPRRAVHAALLLVAAAAVVAPWTARSSFLASQFVAGQGGSALVVYIPTRADLDQQDQGRLWPRFYGEDPYGMRLAAARTPAAMAAADRFGYEQAVRNIFADPVAYVTSRAANFPHLFLNSFDTFTGIHQSFGTLVAQGDVLRIALKLALLAAFSLLPLVLAVAGLPLGRRDGVAALAASVWAYMWIVHLPMWIEYRYWQPVMPLLLVSASGGAAALASAVRAARRGG